MGYTILWLLHLSFALFLVATVCTFASGCKKAFWQRLWPIIIAMLSMFSVTSYAVVGAIFVQENIQPKWLLGYGVSLSVVFVIGCIIILRSGLKGSGFGRSGAQSWPLWKLFVLCASSVGLYFLVANMIETRIILKTTNMNIEASAGLARLLPPNLPGSLNAATSFEEAEKLFQPDNETLKWLDDFDQPDFDVTSQQLASALKTHEKSMQMIRQGVERVSYSFNIGVSNFYSWPIPKFTTYRDLVRLFILSAKRHAAQGDLQLALDDLRVVERMAGHFRQYPILISFMIGRTLDESRVEALEHILANTSQSISDYYTLPVTIPDSVLMDYLHSMKVEGWGQLQGFAFLASSTQNIYSAIYGSTTISPFSQLRTMFWRIFLLPSDLKATKQISGLMTQDANTYEEMTDNYKEISDFFKNGELGVLSAISIPSYVRYAIRAKQYDAHNRLAALAIAVTAHKERTGVYPASIEALIPDYLDKIPNDPFKPASPLSLQAVDGGIDLFSVGPAKEHDSYDEGPIHFYVGKRAYQEFRVKPFLEEKKKKAEKKGKRKKK